MTTDPRPASLTIDVVVSQYGKLLRHRIRQFNVTESEEDCFHQVLLAMITPSVGLGTSYLDRYDPSRGPAQHYVVMFCTQQMMKLHQREKNRRAILPDTIPIVINDSSEDSAWTDEEASESILADPNWNPEALDETIRTPEDLYRFFAGTRHMNPASHSPSGEPRSTVYMLELLLFGGLTVVEIARRLGITAAEVHRRFKALRKEPKILPLLRKSSVA